MKIWIAVEVYELIVQDVHIFYTEAEAEKWFKDYTGQNYGEEIHEDYDETKIFEIELNNLEGNPSHRFSKIITKSRALNE